MILPWAAIGAAVLTGLKTAVAPLLMSLLLGKTFRSILYKPIRWITGKTGTKEDDKIAETIREDWELPAEAPESKIQGTPDAK